MSERSTERLHKGKKGANFIIPGGTGPTGREDRETRAGSPTKKKKGGQKQRVKKKHRPVRYIANAFLSGWGK